jgi:glycosyltransferase involved in cell wall biosynthesis
MKLGWVGVSPEATTGYGRETRDIVSILLERYEVVCIGHIADVIVWGGKKRVPLPGGREVLTLAMTNPLLDPDAQRRAADMLKIYGQRYGIDLFIGHWDAFALEFLNKQELPYLVYVPIDGPMTGKWASYVRDAYRIILYSKFGYHECLNFFPPSKLAYIPHGVNCETFQPIKEDKGKLRREIDASPPIPEDCVLFLFVGTNIGDRKKIPLLLHTFRKLPERAHIYLHTNAFGPGIGRSYDLPIYVDMLGIKDRVHFPRFNPILEGLSDEEMCRIYNAADVYVTNSVAEGYGLPLMEAQSCGLPVIAARNSAQTELVEGHGWLVDNVDPEEYFDIPIYVPQLTWYPVPSQRSLLEKMEEAYSNEDLRRRYGGESRSFALEYSWERVKPLWFKLLEEVEEELNIFKSMGEAEESGMPPL